MSIEVLLVVSLGIFLGFFIQTLIGFAGALIALPILLIVIGLQDAIAYISIFYLYSSALLISKEWKYINKQILIRLSMATVLGVGLGIWVLAYGKPVFLKKLLGVFILLYVMYAVFAKNNVLRKPKLEFLFGFTGGFFSGLFSTGGPLYVIVVKNSAISMETFRATMFGVLGMITIIRIPILYETGLLDLGHIYNSLLVIPFFLLAIYLGKKTSSRLNEAVLRKGVLLLLFISGITLII